MLMKSASQSLTEQLSTRLRAQGLIDARRIRGFYVRKMAVAPESIAQAATDFVASPIPAVALRRSTCRSMPPR